MSIDELIRRPAATLPREATCTAAAALMRDQSVGSIVIVEAGKPVGILTDRDLVLRVMATQRDPERVAVHEVMSRHPAFLPSRSSLEHALQTMRAEGVRRIPTVDAEGRVDGMLSLDVVLVTLGRQIGHLSEAISAELSSE